MSEHIEPNEQERNPGTNETTSFISQPDNNEQQDPGESSHRSHTQRNIQAETVLSRLIRTRESAGGNGLGTNPSQ